MSDHWTVLESRAAVLTDLGRAAVSQGICAFGALDQLAARTANALVANPDDAPLIELSMFDLAVHTGGPAVVALTGAEADLSVDGRPAPPRTPVTVPAGSTLAIHGIRHGVRCYLAVHGSFAGQRFLGSCAPDPVLGFGRALAAGDVLTPTIRLPVPSHPHFGIPLMRVDSGRPPARTGVVDVTDGPDTDEFADPRALYAGTFVAEARSDAVGIRLTGPAPTRTARGEPRSAGVPIGAIEVTGPQQIIALHRGRGVTAGYAIPAVATRRGLDALAQVRPGDMVTFRHCAPSDAVRQHRHDVARLNALRERARTVLANHGVSPAAPALAPSPVL